MHARIALYKVKPGSADLVTQKARTGMLPIFQQQPGYVSYAGVQTGADSVVSISSWDTAEQADRAVLSAAEWVKSNIAEHVVSVENHVGSVAFWERKP